MSLHIYISMRGCVDRRLDRLLPVLSAADLWKQRVARLVRPRDDDERAAVCHASG